MKKNLIIIGAHGSGKTTLTEVIENLACSPDIIIVGEMSIEMHDLKTNLALDEAKLIANSRNISKLLDPPMLQPVYIDDKPGHPFQKFMGKKSFNKKHHR